MLLVELGSILDGVDGELARLTFRFSRSGQWMDTVTDDVSNVLVVTACTISLYDGGMEWIPYLAAPALVAFFLTQATQYYYLAAIYHSGDLAAIPWAFQTSEFLSDSPRGFWKRGRLLFGRLIKRDFFVTLFVALAIAGHLEGVIALFAFGSIVWFFVIGFQLIRLRPSKSRPHYSS
jgi:CDP-L-myo-inositol myo-inositolphosphotransferase